MADWYENYPIFSINKKVQHVSLKAIERKTAICNGLVCMENANPWISDVWLYLLNANIQLDPIRASVYPISNRLAMPGAVNNKRVVNRPIPTIVKAIFDVEELSAMG